MPASARLAAASCVVASLLVSAPARSADLFEPPWDSQSGAYHYDHKRSADIHHGAYRDDDYDDDDRRYKHAPWDDFDPLDHRHADYGACVDRDVARARLHADGWGDFHDLERRGHVVVVRARRPSGRLFDLVIERCSGEVVEARPLYDGRSYAYRSHHDD